MKTKSLFIIIFLTSFLINAQVLYMENFNSLITGNVSGDITGQTSGQGGWYTDILNNVAGNVSDFRIINEVNKGKVLKIKSDDWMDRLIYNYELDINWSQYNVANKVFKISYEFFTGEIITNDPKNYSNLNTFNVYSKQTFLAGLGYNGTSKILYANLGKYNNSGQNGVSYNFKLASNRTQDLILPANTWITVIMYIDYVNSKIYFSIPKMNVVCSIETFFVLSLNDPISSQDPTTNDKPVGIAIWSGQYIEGPNNTCTVKYDNINIEALNVVPPEVIALSTNKQFAQSFSLYPNPATNIVNITNRENLSVEQVIVYDVTGKQLSKQTYSNNEQTIQLNIENLASGTYMLHLHTKNGVAIKKLVKN